MTCFIDREICANSRAERLHSLFCQGQSARYLMSRRRGDRVISMQFQVSDHVFQYALPWHLFHHLWSKKDKQANLKTTEQRLLPAIEMSETISLISMNPSDLESIDMFHFVKARKQKQGTCTGPGFERRSTSASWTAILNFQISSDMCHPWNLIFINNGGPSIGRRVWEDGIEPENCCFLSRIQKFYELCSKESNRFLEMKGLWQQHDPKIGQVERFSIASADNSKEKEEENDQHCRHEVFKFTKFNNLTTVSVCQLASRNMLKIIHRTSQHVRRGSSWPWLATSVKKRAFF